MYLAMGEDRSLAKLAEAMGKGPGYKRSLETWSSAFGWQKRIHEHEKEIFEKERKQLQRDVREMNREHVKLGKEMQRFAIERLQELAAKGSIRDLAAVQLLKLAIDVERQANGEAQKFELGANQEQFDTIIRTVWGRGTDPRRVVDADPGKTEQPPEVTEEPEVRVEFGKETPGEGKDA